MRRLFLIAVVSALPWFVAAQDAARPTRVVVQVSEADPARWSLVPNNVKNLQDELGADMHPGVGYVPAGVVQITKRQQDGWAYLRP